MNADAKNVGVRLAIKRLMNDIKELQENPQTGIGFGPYSENPFEYVANIQIKEGPYKNIIVQFKMAFPQEYPIKPPTLSIFPDQIDHFFHHHVNQDKINIDILQDKYTSNLSLKSILIYLQKFLANPAIPENEPKPTSQDIANLMEKTKNYNQTFQVYSNLLQHSSLEPYPPIHEYVNVHKPNEKKFKFSFKKPLPFNEQTELKQHLTCSVLKTNYIDEPDTTVYGYPIISKGRFNYFPIPTLLSYDAFINQIQNKNIKLDHYFTNTFKLSNDDEYNCWFPIYINEAHYQKNKQTILNALTCLVHGTSGKEKHDFKPSYIVKTFPRLITSMLYQLTLSANSVNEDFLRCFYHFMLLFIKMVNEYKNEISFVNAIKEEKEFNLNSVNGYPEIVKHDSQLFDKQLLSLAREIMLVMFTQNSDECTNLCKEAILKYIEINTKQSVLTSFKEIETECKQIALNQKMIEYFIRNSDNIDNQCYIEFAKTFKHFDELYNIMSHNEMLYQEFKSKNNGKQFIKKVPLLTKAKPPKQHFVSDDDDTLLENEPLPTDKVKDYEEVLQYRRMIKEKFTRTPKEMISLADMNQRNQLISLLIKQNYNLTCLSSLNAETKNIDQLISSGRLSYAIKICDTNIQSKQKIINSLYLKGANGFNLLNVLFTTRRMFANSKFISELERLMGCLLKDQMNECLIKTNSSLNKVKSIKSLLTCGKCQDYMNNEYEYIKSIIKTLK
jgi:ubiquitin-protein ligase